MMRVDIERILELKKEIDSINRADIDDIQFYKDGKIISIPPEILDNWLFIGLNNIEFIESGFYKNGKHT